MSKESSNKIKELKVAVTIAAYDLTSKCKNIQQKKKINFGGGGGNLGDTHLAEHPKELLLKLIR